MTPPDRHILVVESNDITRKLITGILKGQGYDTYEAAGGDAALAFLGKAPALVILDVDDESPDTLGLLHKIQLHHARLPLVAMSDAADLTAITQRLKLDHISILPKPVVPEALLQNISSHLMDGVARNIAPAPPAQPDNTHAAHITADREDFMRHALDLAQEKMDENHGGPFAAVVVKNGAIIAQGWDDVTGTQDPTAHAVLMALRAAAQKTGDYILSGCEVYTSSEPCPMCLGALYLAHVDRVFYAATHDDAALAGFEHKDIAHEIAQPEHKRSLPSHMMLNDEAKIVFENWRKKGDKTPY